MIGLASAATGPGRKDIPLLCLRCSTVLFVSVMLSIDVMLSKKYLLLAGCAIREMASKGPVLFFITLPISLRWFRLRVGLDQFWISPYCAELSRILLFSLYS